MSKRDDEYTLEGGIELDDLKTEINRLNIADNHIN